MTLIRYVVLNGPPGAGKSVLAREISGYLNSKNHNGFAILDSFAAPLKHFFAVALGDKFTQLSKEVQRPELNGYSLRQCWIDLAEEYIKKRFGDDIFGRWLVHRSLRNAKVKPRYYIIDDGGFMPEIDAVPNRFVIQVNRDGKTFKDDSRGYYPEWNHAVLNNGTALAGLWVLGEQIADRLEAYEWID